MSEDRSNEEKSSLFTFEHQDSYQKIQFKFFDAVESMDHNNIIVSCFSHLFGVNKVALVSTTVLFCWRYQLKKRHI